MAAPGAVPAILGFTHDEMYALAPGLPPWFKHLEVDVAMAILFGVGTAHRAWAYYSGIFGKHDDASIAIKALTDFVVRSPPGPCTPPYATLTTSCEEGTPPGSFPTRACRWGGSDSAASRRVVRACVR